MRTEGDAESAETTSHARGLRTLGLSLLGTAVLVPAVCFYLSKYLVKARRKSQKDQRAPKEKRGYVSLAVSTPIPIPPPERAAPGAAPAFVASSDRDRFHVPTCRWVTRILDGNRLTFDSREAALARGLQPCGTCRP